MHNDRICPDCGPATVVHSVEWFSSVMEWLMTPLTRPLAALARWVSPVVSLLPWDRSALPIYRALAALRLGTLTTEVDSRDSLRTKAMWESATKRGITLWQFRLFNFTETNFFVAKYKDKTIAFEGLPRPGKKSSAALEWMDDKGVMKVKFQSAGIPVARGGVCVTKRGAHTIFEQVGVPLIVKPRIGSRSRHTTVHIMSLPQLDEAFEKAKQLSPWVMVEEELQGMVFRGSVIGGKTIAIIRREPAGVVGDGVSSVRTLVEEENKNPARRGPIFHDIPFDKDADIELARQKLHWESIPKKGAWVTINQKVSRSFGASTTDVTEIAHLDNIALFNKVGEVLKDPLVGVDFIIEDITKSWRTQPHSGVIECNSLPFIDLHHYPLHGKAYDVAGALWDLALPEAALRA